MHLVMNLLCGGHYRANDRTDYLNSPYQPSGNYHKHHPPQSFKGLAEICIERSARYPGPKPYSALDNKMIHSSIQKTRCSFEPQTSRKCSVYPTYTNIAFTNRSPCELPMGADRTATQCPASCRELPQEEADNKTGKHPEEEQKDVELFLQFLERFGSIPFRGGKSTQAGQSIV